MGDILETKSINLARNIESALNMLKARSAKKTKAAVVQVAEPSLPTGLYSTCRRVLDKYTNSTPLYAAPSV